jgi:hypothetical protein
VNDQREHYGDAPPAWAIAPAPDPTGLRPCDRAHLAGWIGVFISLILLGIGIGCVRVLPHQPTTAHLLPLVPLAALVVAYACAGTCLIARSLTDRPPTGPLVLVCNVLVVGPIVVPVLVIALGIAPATLIGLIVAYPTAPKVAFWLMTAVFSVVNGI